MRSLRSLAIALWWGVIWGPALGWWAVVPQLLRVEHVHPRDVREWLVLDGALLLILAAGGLIGSLVVWVALEVCSRIAGCELRDREWATAISVLLGLPIVYATMSAAFELVLYTRLIGFDFYRDYWAPVGVVYFAFAILLTLLYRAIIRSPKRPRIALLSFFGVIAISCGIALAPSWGGTSGAGSSEAEPLVSLKQPATERTPLLFIGIDSGAWSVMRPLIDARRMPNLGRLVALGQRGEIRANWHRIFSGPAWSSILTGYDRQATGIYEELSATAPGFPQFQIPMSPEPLVNPVFLLEYWLSGQGYLKLVPFPAMSLRRSPIWQLLTDAGLRVGVIRFRFTFPAAGQASFVISDYVGRDVWSFMGVDVRGEPADLVFPPELSAELLAPFEGRSLRAEELVAELLPRGGPAPKRGAWKTAAESLAVSADIDERTIEAAEWLLRSQGKIDALFVYLGGFDTVCHAFWRYRFPEEFPEDPADPHSVEEFGPVVDHYAEYIDRGIGRLLARYPTPPNVVVVADHGATALHYNRTYSSAHAETDAIFVAAGPDVPYRAESTRLGYLDVAPSVLELLGFAFPSPTLGVSIFKQ